MADTEESAQFAIQMQPLYHQVLIINIIISTVKCSIHTPTRFTIPIPSHCSTTVLHPSLAVYDYDNFDFYDDHDGVDHDHDGDGVKGDHDDNDNDLTRIKC